MCEYTFDNTQVSFSTYGFGFIFMFDYDKDSCPRVFPVSGDYIHYYSRTFRVDCATDFGDSYDMLCCEVK